MSGAGAGLGALGSAVVPVGLSPPAGGAASQPVLLVGAPLSLMFLWG